MQKKETKKEKERTLPGTYQTMRFCMPWDYYIPYSQIK